MELRRGWDGGRHMSIVIKARKALFAKEPYCRECALDGVKTIATQRDHIIPISWGGTEDVSNTQPLCYRCHAAKTAEERIMVKRAQRRIDQRRLDRHRQASDKVIIRILLD